MPGLQLQTDAFVLLKRPPTDRFQGCTVFSTEHGPLHVLQRLPKKSAASQVTLDLFDEAALLLESSNQGQTWFVKEIRLLHRPTGIGRGYETLRLASAFASVIARNRVSEDSRAQVGALLRQVFAAFATTDRPDVVYFKALYCFARDEGYPVRQQWLPMLPAELRPEAEAMLRAPVASLAQAGGGETTSDILIRRLEEYLRGHTEVLLD
jgi:hypothetical protein